MAAGHLAGDVEAGSVLVDGQLDLDQLGESTRKVGVSDLVEGLTAFVGGDHDPAVPQAPQVVGHVRARQVQSVGEFCRVRWARQQRQEYPRASGVGHRPAQALHGIQAGGKSQHALNNTVHAELNFILPTLPAARKLPVRRLDGCHPSGREQDRRPPLDPSNNFRRATLERSQPAIWDSTLSDLRTQARKSRTL